MLEAKALTLEEAVNNATILKRAYKNARGFKSNQEATRSIAVAELELDKEAHELSEHCMATATENKITDTDKVKQCENGGHIQECKNYGYPYVYKRCTAYGQKCYSCGKMGHFSKCCKQKKIFTPSYKETGKGTVNSMLANMVHFL